MFISLLFPDNRGTQPGNKIKENNKRSDTKPTQTNPSRNKIQPTKTTSNECCSLESITNN